MKLFRFRLIAAFLTLFLLVALLPTTQIKAEQSSSQAEIRNNITYMSLEQAGAYLAEKMAARAQNFPLYFKVTDPNVKTDGQAWDAVLAEAQKHTGNGKFGDALRWAQQQSNYGGGFLDGDTFYANWSNMSFIYYSNAQQEQELDTKVNQIINSLNLSGKTDYEKIKAVYEYVCKNVVYAQKAIDGTYAPDTPEWYRAYSAYGALCIGEATCQGFSVAIYRLMLEAGIDCRLIAGDNHGWNIVKLEGKYYLLDATWDSDAWHFHNTFHWFLKGSGNFRDEGHKEWNAYVMDAYAQYNISSLDYGAQTYAPTAIIASGNCGNEGDNVQWKLTGDGTLTLTGTGATSDSYLLHGPWAGYHGYIKKVVIGEGITTIGTYLFYNCTALTEVVFPSTLTTLRDFAFFFCTGLTEITLPNSITECGSSVFSSCFNLKKATLSKGMTKVFNSMFMNCLRLENVSLHEGITELEDRAFANCSKLKGMTFPSTLKRIGNEAFTSAFDPDLKVKLVIPANVTYVGNTCFAWGYLKEVDWKANTPTVEFWTFYNTPYLEKVTFSDSITRIDYECFQWDTNLKDIKLPANLNSMGTSVFESCISLKSITLPTGLTAISDFTFQGSGIARITLHEGITAIGRQAFHNSQLTEIVLPASLKILENGALSSCRNLRKITFKGSLPSRSNLDVYPIGNDCEIHFPYGDPTWDAEGRHSLAAYLAGITWKTQHPAGAKHVLSNDLQMQHDNSGHWHACLGCDEKVDYAEHDLTEMMQDGDQWIRYCTTCWATLYYNGPDDDQACSHTYDNACDTRCNKCDAVRTVGDHVYSDLYDTDCNNCGATRDVSYQPTETKPTEPKPTETKPTEPKPTEPKPTEPTPTVPQPTGPASTTPQPTGPAPTGSQPAETKPAGSAPTEPAPTVPQNQPEAPADYTIVILVVILVVLGGGAAGAFFFLKKKKAAGNTNEA